MAFSSNGSVMFGIAGVLCVSFFFLGMMFSNTMSPTSPPNSGALSIGDGNSFQFSELSQRDQGLSLRLASLEAKVKEAAKAKPGQALTVVGAHETVNEDAILGNVTSPYVRVCRSYVIVFYNYVSRLSIEECVLICNMFCSVYVCV
jgi:hypothetical protein